MFKHAMLLVATFALFSLLHSSVNTVDAHGTIFRGPSSDVPPGQRDPKDPQPPPENPATPGTKPGDGSGTPSPGNPPGEGGPETPGSPPPAPPPLPPGPSGPGIGGGTHTPGRGRTAPRPMSFSNWLFWWAYNKDEILNLKDEMKRADRQVSPGSPGYYLGRARGGRPVESATPRMIREKIVPALTEVIQNKKIHPDIRGGALIALARARPKNLDPEFFFGFAAPGSGEPNLVYESAIVALGVRQERSTRVRDFLIGLVKDRNYPMRGRCFAMLSLGLLRDKSKSVHDALVARLDGSEPHLDIPVCAILAIGLVGDTERVPQLVGWLDAGHIGRNRLSDVQKAWIVSALGKMRDPRALPAIGRTLRQKGRYTRRSAAIAMGQIAPGTDASEQLKLARQLSRFHRTEGDLTARNFALIALGRMAASPTAASEVTIAVKDFLKRTFLEANVTTERPFVALAMGLVGFPAPGKKKDPALREELAGVIRPRLESLKGDPTALGALAVSLGMLGDRQSVPLLIRILEDRGNERRLRGAAALGLGLIGDSRAGAAIRKALEERGNRMLRIDTAVASGLLGDPGAVDGLVRALQDRKSSQFVLGSVALALGQIGDHRAIDSMIAILEPGKTNGTFPDATRALVVVALGQLADGAAHRVLSRLSRDINYRASVPALDEILTII